MKRAPYPWWIDGMLFETEEELLSFFDALNASSEYVEEWWLEAKVKEREIVENESK